MKGEDLHAGVKNEGNPVGFGGVEEEDEAYDVDDERQIWLSNEHDHLLADVQDGSLFYTGFPPLPDFPCMSSSSSSSSTPAPVKGMTSTPSTSSASSSSSAASWAVLKSDAEEAQHDNHRVDATPGPELISTASMEISQPLDQGLEGVDCMDVMDTFGYLDLLESNDFFEPSCIFQDEDFPQMSQEEHALQGHAQQQQQQQEHDQLILQNNNDDEEIHEENKDPDDMASVFLEWLRTNKDSVSAEDLRNVRIKKSTIECAARRLGGGKEAMKQLLKLVLEWVQTNHLQRRRAPTPTHFSNQYQYQDTFQNPSPNLNSNSLTPESNPGFTNQSTWIPAQPPYVPEPTAAVAAPAGPDYPSMVGYMGDPYTNGGCSNMSMNSNGNSPCYPANPTEYHMLDSSHSWPSSQFSLQASHYNTFSDNNNIHLPPQQAFAGYGNQYPYQYFPGHGERLVRLGSSATKEARKKRMARQRRFLSHHRHHHNPHNPQNQHQQQIHNTDQHTMARLGSDNCTTATAGQANQGNWVYWTSAGAPSASSVMPAEAPPVHLADRTAMQAQNLQGRVALDRRQVRSLTRQFINLM